MGGCAPGAPPLDPPMQYVPKYHQKLGCQANGGARAGHAPPRSANDGHQLKCSLNDTIGQGQGDCSYYNTTHVNCLKQQNTPKRVSD